MIVTKKTTESLGMSIFDGVGSKVSVFARRQMEKMGWEEGKGLGKNETGIVKHIKAVKRDDNSGLGLDEVKAAELPDNWWHDGFSKNLKAYSSSTGGKMKKSKKRSNNETDVDDNGADAPPSYAELFAATGGARLGMRARASQNGKILRTEGPLQSEIIETSGHVQQLIEVCLEPKVKRKKTKVLKTVASDEIDRPKGMDDLSYTENTKELPMKRKKTKTVDTDDAGVSVKKVKKSRKGIKENIDSPDEIEEPTVLKEEKQEKKKKKKKISSEM